MDREEINRRYIVRTDGTIYSRYWKKELNLTPNKATGYVSFTYRDRKNNVEKTKMAHRLIATIHVPNPDNKPHINHKNGIKTDNRAENLEWVTRSENQLHAYRTGLQKPTKVYGDDNKISKALSFFDVKTSELLHEFNSLLSAAKHFGASKQMIGRVARGERSRYKGMFILYKNY